jgi:hypothetical protein
MAVPTAITFLDIKGQDSLILPEAWDAVHEPVSSQPLEAVDNGQLIVKKGHGFQETGLIRSNPLLQFAVTQQLLTQVEPPRFVHIKRRDGCSP